MRYAAPPVFAYPHVDQIPPDFHNSAIAPLPANFVFKTRVGCTQTRGWCVKSEEEAGFFPHLFSFGAARIGQFRDA